MQLANQREALHLMERALDLLDGSDSPGELGAQLDLVICRLRELVAPIHVDGPDPVQARL